MKMIDYVLKLHPTNERIIITKTDDENVFYFVSFLKILDGMKAYGSFVCTDGKVLLNYCPEDGELTRYDYVEDNWEYYSWTFGKKELFSALIKESNFKELYEELKKAL